MEASSKRKSLLCVVSVILSLAVLLAPSSALPLCGTQSVHLHSNKAYENCADLPTLNSQLHWTFSPANSTLDVAFLSPPPSDAGWVSWAINPTATGMAGAQALIAFRNQTDGSMALKTYNIASYSSIVEGDLDVVRVLHKIAEYSDGLIKIYATMALPAALTSSGTINHLWQVGPSFTGGFPARHDFNSENLNSLGTLDLAPSSAANTTAPHHHHHSSTSLDKWTNLKNAHGIMNGISWGFLFPVGVIIARYLKTVESANPAWFYLHLSCQMLGYILGVAGWATGLAIGSHTKGIVHTAHRSIGIALFCLATNQILAMGFRPSKESKYRLWWTIYHRSVGYATVVLGIVNVFGGLNILKPGKKWTLAYAIVLVVLGCVSVALEGITWAVLQCFLLRSQGGATNLHQTHPLERFIYAQQPITF